MKLSLLRTNMIRLRTRSRDGVKQAEPPMTKQTECTTALIVAVNLKKPTAQYSLVHLIVIMTGVLVRASGGEKQLWKR